MVGVQADFNKVCFLKYISYNIVNQIKKSSTDIIVATPGRLIDLLQNEGLDLSNVLYQILDEGDKMLEMGF